MRSEYTDEFESFNQAYVRERYRHRSGRKTRLDLEPVFDRFGYLFRADEIDALRVAEDDAFYERDRTALRYLRAAAVERHLDAGVRALTEEIETHISRATVDWMGREVAFEATRALLGNERRPDARRELGARRERVFEETNDLRAERFEKRLEAARVFGASSYLALRSELAGVDFAALAGEARRLLTATERPYAEALEPALVERADVRRQNAVSVDLPRLFRLEEFDRAFPAARLPVVYRDALAGLGIRTGAQSNVALDLEPRATKHARPFCAPIRVPEEVVLVVRASGGYGDYRGLLRTAGIAQHNAFTSPDTRVAFKRAGDPAASEVYGLLLQNLLLDRDWLDERFGLGAARPLRRLAALDRFVAVRRCAGAALYEEELCSQRRSLAGARERYVETLSEATMVAEPAAEYLTGLDEPTAAGSLRALALEVALRDHLKTRFGRKWWANRRAGELLKELWSTGNEYTVEGLAEELRLGELSFEPLESDLVEGVRP